MWHRVCGKSGSGGGVMRNFFAAVLSVIAAGVLLIAYGLLSPRVAAMDVYPSARPMLASERAGDIEDLTLRPRLAYAVSDIRPGAIYADSRRAEGDELRRVEYAPGRQATARAAPARGGYPPRGGRKKKALGVGGRHPPGAG